MLDFNDITSLKRAEERVRALSSRLMRLQDDERGHIIRAVLRRPRRAKDLCSPGRGAVQPAPGLLHRVLPLNPYAATKKCRPERSVDTCFPGKTRCATSGRRAVKNPLRFFRNTALLNLWSGVVGGPKSRMLDSLSTSP